MLALCISAGGAASWAIGHFMPKRITFSNEPNENLQIKWKFKRLSKNPQNNSKRNGELISGIFAAFLQTC